MRRVARGNLARTVACALLMVASALGSGLPLGAAPVVVPPTLMSPVNMRVDAPFLFQWSAVSPGQIFNVHTSGGRTVRSATSLVGVSYELQISDRVDVTSHELYDVIVDQTSYLFSNTPSDGFFTGNQPPNTPLAGGRYFWRVRALFAGSSSPFSSVSSFTIVSNGVAPLHALGLVGISVAGVARQSSTSLVVINVGNIGNFPESGATLEIFADGTSLGTADVPPLAAGARQTFSVPWTPQSRGFVLLNATLQYADDDVPAHSVSLTSLVLGSKAVATAMIGTLDRELGNLTLIDAGGVPVATVVRGEHYQGPDLADLVQKRVRLTGLLFAERGVFVLVVTSEQTLPGG